MLVDPKLGQTDWQSCMDVTTMTTLGPAWDKLYDLMDMDSQEKVQAAASAREEIQY